MVVLLTALACLARSALALLDVVLLYVLVIAAVGAAFGRGPSLLAAALSVAAYDFFFVPPVFAFRVNDVEHVATFALMFGIGCAISALTWRTRNRERQASLRRERTRALARLSSELDAATDELDASRIVARHAAELFHRAAAVVRTNPGTELQVIAADGGAIGFGPDEMGAVRRALAHVEPTGFGTNVCPRARVSCWPLQVGGTAISALAVAPGESPHHDTDLLEAFAYQSALALARLRLAREAHSAARRAQSEEMRGSLLSVVSHDLRAPLAVITSAATSLKSNPERTSSEARARIAATICDEAGRIEHLVSNLLEMASVDAHRLEIRPEPLAVDEVVSSVLARVKTALEDREVTLELPDTLPPIVVDRVLIGQVFLNLFDNIVKYTPARSPVEIRVRSSSRSVDIEIIDRGPGLAPGSEKLVFEKFYRGKHPGKPGSGLGLSICRGIVEAHGGIVSAHNAPHGGAVFRVSLPITAVRGGGTGALSSAG